MSFVTLDLETYYNKSTGYSLSKMTTESYIRDSRFEMIGVGVRVDDGEIDWTTGVNVEPRLRDLNLQNHYLCCHNAAFDGSILSWRYGIKPKFYVDTLSMARPLQGLIKKLSLGALAAHFNLGVKGSEVEHANGMRLSDFSEEALAQYGEYCKNDVLLTYLLYHVLKQYSTPQEMYIIDMFLRLYTDPILLLDRSVLQAHLLKVQANKTELMARIDQSIGRESLMSNLQFAAVLGQLGVDPPMKVSTTTGKETFALAKNDPEFKALLEHDDPRVQAVVAARIGIKSTLEETRTERLIDISKRGTLPIMLNYYGGHTGRVSGGDQINPQNFTRGSQIRHAIYAPDGHNLIAGDSAQIEARLLAWFAGEFELVSDFRQGVDIYSKFASSVYDEPVTKANIDRRFVGKTCILALGYGTGAEKLQATLKRGRVIVDLAEAKRIVDFYRNQFVMITNLWKLADEALRHMEKGYEYELGVHLKLHCTQDGITLPNGMMLRYPNLHRTRQGAVYTTGRGPQKLYGAKMVENIIQALARIVLFTQTARLDQWLRKRDTEAVACADGVWPAYRYKLVHSVHDEIVVCVPNAAVMLTMPKMVEVMTAPLKWCEGLPLACEVASGQSYGACK